ncbi:hypothetical protein D3C76_435740 [compost metagenome]
MLEQRRGHFNADGLRNVVADDRQARFGHARIEIDNALVIRRAFEEWRQNHYTISAAVLGMTRAFQHILHQQGRGLHDDTGAPIDDLRTEGDELLGFILAEINVHPRSRAQHKTMDACGDVTLYKRFKAREIDFPAGIEGRGDCEVHTGKTECRHLS